MGDKNYQELLVIPVAVAVLAVWVAAAAYSFLSNEYAPLITTTPVMLALAGYVFGFKQVSKALTNGKDKNGGT